MQEFAWHVLQEVHHRNCDYWILYAFSNGGCFVWEQVRRTLNESIEKQYKLDEEQHAVIQNLHQQLSGVIFDSCPSRELAGIGHALALCTLSERTEVMLSHGMDVAFFPSKLSEEKRTLANIRGESYYDGLMNDPFNIPQLYLYSESDALIPCQDVDALFEHRREIIGSNFIFGRKFDNSRHCAHFIDNPDDYVVAVGSFLEVCHPKSTPPAKL